MSVAEGTEHESVEEPADQADREADQADREADQAADREADHDLVMATARRVIATDAAIIHRLGTV